MFQCFSIVINFIMNKHIYKSKNDEIEPLKTINYLKLLYISNGTSNSICTYCNSNIVFETYVIYGYPFCSSHCRHNFMVKHYK